MPADELAMPATAEHEYDSGFSDGFEGLSFVKGESAEYNKGFSAGRTNRATNTTEGN